MMKAVILAAGMGKRLGDITRQIPKAMVLVKGKPILEKIILQLKTHGILDFVVVVGYKKEVIMNYFGDGGKLGVRISYAEQKEQLGTGHALLQAEKHLLGEDKFLMSFADISFDDKVLDKMIETKWDGVVLTEEVDDPRQYGIVELDENGFVTNLVEKPENPTTNLKIAGIYVMPYSIFSALHRTPISPRGEYEIPTAVVMLIKEGTKFKTVVANEVIDIGTPEQLKKINEDYSCQD